MSTTAAAAPPKSGWTITARPVGKNEDSQNESHMLVILKHSGMGGEQPIAAVAIEREFAHKDYKKLSFDEKLDEELEKAVKCIQVLDDLLATGGKGLV